MIASEHLEEVTLSKIVRQGMTIQSTTYFTFCVMVVVVIVLPVVFVGCFDPGINSQDISLDFTMVNSWDTSFAY